ncbi:hypothetical protein DDQ41_29640 [Streptomyces spongiicola]|uniref:Secreted protein n=1 Tax=Streptomyces spongiicola TaxID=1690221 RepID=A0ABN5KQC7_9ACTN|nr:hypothetical protein [Streptomyces spongiicola]AWK12393.1 hypothetical protein DDQ41_29640 [Streptomyces spongiicola]
MDLTSLAKRPLRAARAGVVAGLATVALMTTAGTAAAAPAAPASHTTDAAATIGAGAGRLPAGLPTPQQAPGILCGQVETAARGGAVPAEVLALCKRVNGWD